MDLRILLILLLAVEIFCVVANANLVFPVQRRQASLTGIKAHDSSRRGRILSAVDFNLGGNGLPTVTGFVFLISVQFSSILSYEWWIVIYELWISLLLCYSGFDLIIDMLKLIDVIDFDLV